MMSPYFGLGVHKFPKVPRQYFVTPVFDNQNLYDPPQELQYYHKPIMQPLLSVALIICMGVVIEHKLSKILQPPNNILFISS